jgi:hypothetical protein
MISSHISKAVAASAGAGILALTAAWPAAADDQQQSAEAMVSVFHGVPGLTVDVYANGDKLLPDFEPGTLTDPQPLKAGSYDLKVFAAGEDPEGTPAVEKTVDVPAGADATVVAHLDADGEPVLTAFVNDTSEVPAGKARLTVRHVAAAPAVDVRADGTPVFTGLENPNEDTGEVDAGTVSADVVLAGTDTVAIGPADVELNEGTSNVVYAWGSADDENLALKTQTFSGMHSAPSGVDAGEGGGFGAEDRWLGWTAGAGLAVGAGLVLARRLSERRSAVSGG